MSPRSGDPSSFLKSVLSPSTAILKCSSNQLWLVSFTHFILLSVSDNSSLTKNTNPDNNIGKLAILRQIA